MTGSGQEWPEVAGSVRERSGGTLGGLDVAGRSGGPPGGREAARRLPGGCKDRPEVGRTARRSGGCQEVVRIAVGWSNEVFTDQRSLMLVSALLGDPMKFSPIGER